MQALGKAIIGRKGDEMLGQYEFFGETNPEKVDKYDWVDIDTTKSPNDEDYYVYGGNIIADVKAILAEKYAFVAIDCYDGGKCVDVLESADEEKAATILEEAKDEDLQTPCKSYPLFRKWLLQI